MLCLGLIYENVYVLLKKTGKKMTVREMAHSLDIGLSTIHHQIIHLAQYIKREFVKKWSKKLGREINTFVYYVRK